MSMPKITSAAVGAALLLLAAAVLVSCSSAPWSAAGAVSAPTIDPADEAAVARMLDELADRRVVYVGEIHDHYDHHRNQLAVIRGLHERGVDLAVGLEQFQHPFQRHLDDYAAGRIAEEEMLRRTQYFSRWRFDFRHYREILDYAREQGIPLVALNAPSELVDAVSRQGIEGLSRADRALLPTSIAPADDDYEKRLRAAFRMHGDLSEERFRRFMQVQSVWDEYMAARGAEYLQANPDKTLVVLVGAAHVLHDAAIPARLRSRTPLDQAVVVTRPFEPLPGVAPDFVLAARDLSLPPTGRIGMSLRGGEDGVRVQRVTAKGAAERAGLEVGDRVVRIDGRSIDQLEDVRLALLDTGPGDRVRVEVQRSGDGKRMARELVLL